MFYFLNGKLLKIVAEVSNIKLHEFPSFLKNDVLFSKFEEIYKRKPLFETNTIKFVRVMPFMGSENMLQQPIYIGIFLINTNKGHSNKNNTPNGLGIILVDNKIQFTGLF